MATNSHTSAWIQRTADLTEGRKPVSLAHSVAKEHKAKSAFHSEILPQHRPVCSGKRGLKDCRKAMQKGKHVVWLVSSRQRAETSEPSSPSSLRCSHWPHVLRCLGPATPHHATSLWPQLAKASQSLSSNSPPENCPSHPPVRSNFSFSSFVNYHKAAGALTF